METKQTALEYLIEKLDNNLDINHSWRTRQYIEQAKAMEKEQIKDAFVECWKANVPNGIECKLYAELYYNETYGK